MSLDVAVRFVSAKAVWAQGCEDETNLFVGFRTTFERPRWGRTTLRIAGTSCYRIWLNGRFLGYGPARGPHGFYRVDEWDLDAGLAPGRNLLAIEVAAYHVNSYCYLDAPGFLQTEVICEGKVLASTAGRGSPLEAGRLTHRVQKVQRYGFQRTFTEVYRLGPGSDTWRTDADAPFASPVPLVRVGTKKLLARVVPYPRFRLLGPAWHVARGRVEATPPREGDEADHLIDNIGPHMKGYRREELEWIPALELKRTAVTGREDINREIDGPVALDLSAGTFEILDFGKDATGFLGLRVRCRGHTRLYATFGENLIAGDVDFRRTTCVDAVAWALEPGEYELESFEPYTMKYVKLIVLEGSCEVEDLHLREYVNPAVWEAHFAASDPRLMRLFEAARETFAQNSVDLFMDCPGRERAGWLCDSFFTARVALDLTGEARIERNFYENYLLPKRFADLPDGMLPMCYPADHSNGNFIPNWAMWFVLELEEYLARSGDRAMVDAMRDKVFNLLRYFERFRNSDGLLEKLEQWVFVEWSKANDFVQDVNYPSNMLYAAMLASAGRLYGCAELLADAERVRETVRRQSFDGEFFVDNAVRRDGRLEVTRNRTEVCQYFAFYFDVAGPATHAKLWDTLIRDFGPDREKRGLHPEIHAANAFVGNYLRLELLSRYGRCEQILRESIDYFLYMAERTGTLWENVHDRCSCNHGFASHVAHVLYRDVLGLHRVDSVNRRIDLRFTKLPLEWCEGRIPIGTDAIRLRWWKDGTERLCYRIEYPLGYHLTVENLTAHGVTRVP